MTALSAGAVLRRGARLALSAAAGAAAYGARPRRAATPAAGRRRRTRMSTRRPPWSIAAATRAPTAPSTCARCCS